MGDIGEVVGDSDILRFVNMLPEEGFDAQEGGLGESRVENLMQLAQRYGLIITDQEPGQDHMPEVVGVDGKSYRVQSYQPTVLWRKASGEDGDKGYQWLYAAKPFYPLPAIQHELHHLYFVGEPPGGHRKEHSPSWGRPWEGGSK